MHGRRGAAALLEEAVYMCIYIYVYMYVHMYMYTHVQYIHIHTHTYIHMYIYMHSGMGAKVPLSENNKIKLYITKKHLMPLFDTWWPHIDCVCVPFLMGTVALYRVCSTGLR